MRVERYFDQYDTVSLVTGKDAKWGCQMQRLRLSLWETSSLWASGLRTKIPRTAMPVL